MEQYENGFQRFHASEDVWPVTYCKFLLGSVHANGIKKYRALEYSPLILRASLCKILISSFAHKMVFAHNFSVDFF